MSVRTAFLLAAAAVAVAGACGEHDPVIVGQSGGAPVVDGGEPLGRTDPVPWCDVFTVLSCKCQRCHTDPPENKAPFPLRSYEDLQAPYAGTKLIWQVMRGAVANEFMPPTFLPDLMPPVEMLTDFEKATLIGWADQGAKLLGPAECAVPAAESCPKVVVDGGGGAGGEAGAGAAGGASAGAGGN